MKYVAWLLIALLIWAHLDIRQFSRSDLIYDFLPYPLAYHMLISVATAFAWLLVVQFNWPKDVDEPDADKIANDHSISSGDAQ